jgi:hypothetical protein
VSPSPAKEIPANPPAPPALPNTNYLITPNFHN